MDFAVGPEIMIASSGFYSAATVAATTLDATTKSVGFGTIFCLGGAL